MIDQEGKTKLSFLWLPRANGFRGNTTYNSPQNGWLAKKLTAAANANAAPIRYVSLDARLG
jgi:hypothetical protein